MPPKTMVKSVAMKGACGWKLALAIRLYKDEIRSHHSAFDLLHPQKGIRAKIDGVVCSKKTGRTQPSGQLEISK